MRKDKVERFLNSWAFTPFLMIFCVGLMFLIIFAACGGERENLRAQMEREQEQCHVETKGRFHVMLGTRGICAWYIECRKYGTVKDCFDATWAHNNRPIVNQD